MRGAEMIHGFIAVGTLCVALGVTIELFKDMDSLEILSLMLVIGDACL